MTILKAILNIFSAIAAIIAAFFWFKSTLVRIPYSEEAEETLAIVKDNIDLIATGDRQNIWNRYAALAASVAALTQGISLLIATD